MATLAELCSGLPLDPLPPFNDRNPNIQHAPVRTLKLKPNDKRVQLSTIIVIYVLISIVCTLQ